jgi:hypothetical protein
MDTAAARLTQDSDWWLDRDAVLQGVAHLPRQAPQSVADRLGGFHAGLTEMGFLHPIVSADGWALGRKSDGQLLSSWEVHRRLASPHLAVGADARGRAAFFQGALRNLWVGARLTGVMPLTSIVYW